MTEQRETEHSDVDSDSEIDGDLGGFDVPIPTIPRDEQQYAGSLENALIAARCADDLRATNVVVLDMTARTSIVDFFVIATATNSRQMHAIADEVNRQLKRERGNQRVSLEGYRTEANWLLTDFGDVVVHVFTPDGRALYDLEQLWADAKRIEWKEE